MTELQMQNQTDPLIVNMGSLWRSIIRRAQEIEAEDFVHEHAPPNVVRHLERAKNKKWEFLNMADGLLYRDLRQPILIADNAAITLSSTALDLYLVTQFGALPANYWTPGKTINVTAYGKITTAATPGNGTFSLSVNPTVNTSLVSSTAKALTANQTNLSWRCLSHFQCRTTGTSGTFRMSGVYDVNVSVVASTLAPILVPDATPADTTQDTTAATNVRLEVARSGSTAETMTTTMLFVEAID
jgi:hypothetical protein